MYKINLDMIVKLMKSINKSTGNMKEKLDGKRALFMIGKQEGNNMDHEDVKGTTGLLNEKAASISNEEGSVLLTENVPGQDNRHHATLVRGSTGEKVELNKPLFYLGKQKERNDYCVDNNRYISMIHAAIITRGNRYFVIDNKSVNGTLINGRRIGQRRQADPSR